MRKALRQLAIVALVCGVHFDARAETAAKPPGAAVATFAGECFWCTEPPFDKIPGGISTTSGYTSGVKRNPTYEEVSSGTTGHAEAVEVVYDPAKVSYEKLLGIFWHNIDPTVTDRQFCDHAVRYNYYRVGCGRDARLKQLWGSAAAH